MTFPGTKTTAVQPHANATVNVSLRVCALEPALQATCKLPGFDSEVNVRKEMFAVNMR